MTKLGVTKSQVLAMLHAQVGTKESPAGSNNTKYGKAYGMDGVYWCAIFVWCMLTYMGKKLFGFKSAYVPDYVNWAKKNKLMRGRDYLPKAGDIIVFKMPGPARPNHIGFVVGSKKNGKVPTIEGNTGGSNPRMGGMVAAQERSTTYIYGFIDMQGLYSAPKPKPKPKPKPAAKKYVLKHDLRRGSKGEAVKALQRKLKGYDCYSGKIDGIFGARTEAALVRFQKRRKLTADGVCGAKTARSMGWDYK